MMGPKKLGAIRRELRQAFSRTGSDPIQWLEERIRALQASGEPAPQVLQSLRRFLQTPKKATRKPRKAPIKK